MTLLLTTAALILLILINVPIAVAIGIVALGGLLLTPGGATLYDMAIALYSGTTSFPLIAIPLFILWDGIVSCFRIYNEEELLSMAKAADPDGRYDWEVRAVPIPLQPFPGIALVGIPR